MTNKNPTDDLRSVLAFSMFQQGYEGLGINRQIQIDAAVLAFASQLEQILTELPERWNVDDPIKEPFRVGHNQAITEVHQLLTKKIEGMYEHKP